jgi:hypothetical protein
LDVSKTGFRSIARIFLPKVIAIGGDLWQTAKTVTVRRPKIRLGDGGSGFFCLAEVTRVTHP